MAWEPHQNVCAVSERVRLVIQVTEHHSVILVRQQRWLKARKQDLSRSNETCLPYHDDSFKIIKIEFSKELKNLTYSRSWIVLTTVLVEFSELNKTNGSPNSPLWRNYIYNLTRKRHPVDLLNKPSLLLFCLGESGTQRREDRKRITWITRTMVQFHVKWDLFLSILLNWK